MSDNILEPPAHFNEAPPPEAYSQSPARPPVARVNLPSMKEQELDASAWDALPPHLREVHPATPELDESVAAVLAEMDWVKKRGHNTFHDYMYATADDIRGHVANIIGRHGLSFEVHEGFHAPEGDLIKVAYWFRLTHKSGQTAPLERVTVYVSKFVGRNRTPDDKAFSKARSLAVKDWAKVRFSVPTGEDPSNDPDWNNRRPEDDQQSQGGGSSLDRINHAAQGQAGGQTSSAPRQPTPEQIAKAQEVCSAIVLKIATCKTADDLAAALTTQEVIGNLTAFERYFPDQFQAVATQLSKPENMPKAAKIVAKLPNLHAKASAIYAQNSQATQSARRSGHAEKNGGADDDAAAAAGRDADRIIDDIRRTADKGPDAISTLLANAAVKSSISRMRRDHKPAYDKIVAVCAGPDVVGSVRPGTVSDVFYDDVIAKHAAMEAV